MAEAAPTLPEIANVDLGAYQRNILQRFANPAIRDTVARLCAETSDRIPKFVVPTIVDNLAAGRDVTFGAAVCASWARYAEGIDEQGHPINVVDHRAADRRDAARLEAVRPGAFLEDESLFGKLARHKVFLKEFRQTLAGLQQRGARATYGALVSKTPTGTTSSHLD